MKRKRKENYNMRNPKGKERYRKEEKKAKQKGRGRSTCLRGKMEDHASNGGRKKPFDGGRACKRFRCTTDKI